MNLRILALYTSPWFQCLAVFLCSFTQSKCTYSVERKNGYTDAANATSATTSILVMAYRVSVYSQEYVIVLQKYCFISSNEYVISSY